MGIHFDRGQALFDLRRYRQAADAYRQELAEDPGNALVYAVLAAALINDRQVRQADRAVRQAIALDPACAYAFYILSVVECSRGQLAEAKRAIAEAIRLEQSPDSFHQWAVVADRRGQMAEALAATAEALRLNPGFSPAIILRGRLLAETGKLGEAHSLYSMALRNNPSDAAAQHAMGSLRLRTGDAAGALDMLREARRLDPITANDASAIALAYGRQLPPFKSLDRFVWRWHRLTPKQRWLLFALFGAAFATFAMTWHGTASPTRRGLLGWTVCCVLAMNYAVLPMSFDHLAAAAGRIALWREFGSRWFTWIWRPLVLIPMCVAHLIATGLAIAIAGEPVLGLLVMQFAATFPLIAVGALGGTTRLTGYICVFLVVVPMFVGAIGGVLVSWSASHQDQLVGFIILSIVFAWALFSDNVARGMVVADSRQPTYR